MGFNKVLQLHLPHRCSHSLDLHNLPIYLHAYLEHITKDDKILIETNTHNIKGK